MAKPNFTLPNKPAIKSGSILSYNYTDDFTFVPAPLTFNRDSAATRVNEKGLIEDVGYFGPELVQNGDFSEIGSELVTNGDFSTSGTPNTSSWSLGWYSNTNNVIISDGKLTMTNSASESDARVYATNGTSSNNIITTNKFYKLQYDIVSNNGVTDFRYYSEAGEFISVPSVEIGSYTIYIRNTSNSLFLFQNRTSNSSISIDNVSIKEVGQNWDFTDGATITDNGVRIVSDGTYQRATQYNILTVGKNYKVQYEIVENNSGNLKMSSSFGITPIPSTVGTHIINGQALQTFLTIERSGACDVTIDNISVVEVLGDKPRIDYSDSLTEPSLLLEPQSTNLVTESEDFSEWSLGVNATLSYVSDVVAPDGSFGVYRLQLPATGATYIASNSFTGQNPLALSIYAKSVNTNNDFNLYDGSISSPIKTATNEWQRFDYIGNGNQFYIINSGDTFVTDIYIWGAQAEALPYATSYIPTAGSTATRLGETANNAGDVNVFNSEEGVLYAEVAALDNDSTYRLMSISDGTFTNRITLGYNNSSNQLLVQVHSSGISQVDFRYSISDITLYNKIALLYKSNEVTIWVNGVKGTSDTIASMPIGLSEFNLNYTYGLPLYAKVKDVKVFNKALTDRELEILTIQ